ncbi:MAG: HD domain-containing protein [Clostridiales bacterium]|nr:HD domain-containing protein [Clostridiales bacterium]
MEYNLPISEMKAGMSVEGFYIFQDGSVKMTQAGKPFLTGTLEDKSGTIELKSWEYAGPVGADDAGHVVKVRGEISDYKGAPQITVARIRRTSAADVYNVADLVPTAPIDREDAMREVRRLVDSIRDEDYRKIASALFAERGDAFAVIPAAKSVHHSFLGGLLMHTATMLRIADFLAGLYPETVSRDLLLAGTVLHDIAKTEEFAFSELGLVTEYSARGKLLGHLVMGADAVRRTAEGLGVPEEKTMLLCHMILSHHGEPEFGAAVKPRCAEADLLSLIDLIDSRMEIYRESLEGLTPGTFSQKIYALDRDIYRHE